MAGGARGYGSALGKINQALIRAQGLAYYYMATMSIMMNMTVTNMVNRLWMWWCWWQAGQSLWCWWSIKFLIIRFINKTKSCVALFCGFFNLNIPSSSSSTMVDRQRNLNLDRIVFITSPLHSLASLPEVRSTTKTSSRMKRTWHKPINGQSPWKPHNYLPMQKRLSITTVFCRTWSFTFVFIFCHHPVSIRYYHYCPHVVMFAQIVRKVTAKEKYERRKETKEKYKKVNSWNKQVPKKADA